MLYYLLCFILNLIIMTQFNNYVHTGKFLTNFKTLINIMFQEINSIYNNINNYVNTKFSS